MSEKKNVRRIKGIRIVMTALVVCILVAQSGLFVFAATVSTYEASTSRPDVHARGAIVWCGETGSVLYGKNVDEKLDPLSITKIMTVYCTMLAIDRGDITLDTKFTATKAEAKLEESKIYLQVGEKMRVKDLIYAALLPSANDAAALLGRGLAGDEKSFAKLMNDEAKKLGCTNTSFRNAHGLIVKGHYSSAHDLALIARASFSYDFVQKVCQTKKYTIAATNKYPQRTIELTNPFFKKHKKMKHPNEVYHILAGKTGTWDYGNASLVEMSEYEGKHIYTVVLGDELAKRFSDSKKLITYGRSVFDEEKAMEEALEPRSVPKTYLSQFSDNAYAERVTAFVNRLAKKTLCEIQLAEVTEKGVQLEWKTGPHAASYRIYRAEGNGDFQHIQSIEGNENTTYLDESIEKDRVYRYLVRENPLTIPNITP